MEARPRPSGVRRVTAKKRPRPDASSNSARKLQRREIAAFPERTFAASTTRERFRNIQLQVRLLPGCLLVNCGRHWRCLAWVGGGLGFRRELLKDLCFF